MPKCVPAPTRCRHESGHRVGFRVVDWRQCVCRILFLPHIFPPAKEWFANAVNSVFDCGTVAAEEKADRGKLSAFGGVLQSFCDRLALAENSTFVAAKFRNSEVTIRGAEIS